MKRFAMLLVSAVAALAFAVPALAADAAPAADPVGSFTTKKVDLNLWVDTITSTRGDVVQKRGCMIQTNFTRGNRAVWRMWITDAATGKAITDQDIKYAYVKVPGSPNLPFTFGKHGRLDISPWFWTAVFAVPKDYPLGSVDFKVVVKTKDGRFGTYTQPADGLGVMTITG